VAASRRVLVIGLDGATLDLILPWVDEGKLPAFAKILAGGTSGRLQSTVPPMTFPAWTSLMTGKNPGKHGIYDFTEREPGGYGIRFVNANWVKAKTIWRLLSDAGRRVAAVSVPVTYPPEPVNGLMISGFDAPGMGRGKADARSMYPASLYQELLDEVGGYVISANAAALSGTADRALRAVLATMDQKIRCAKYLYRKEPWDVFMIVLGETDAIAHHFWKHHDPASPFHAPGPYRDAILSVYQRADTFIGDMLGQAWEGTTLLVVSDHGVGGYSDMAVFPNLWLAREGFLCFRASREDRGVRALGARGSELGRKVLGGVKRLGVRTIPPVAKAWLLRRRPSLVNSVESYLRFNAIDWEGTRAFADENPHYPQIWLNVRGREARGIVDPGREYDALRDAIGERLRAWTDPETGQPVVKRVLKREEIYAGAHVEKAPDLSIDWNLRGNYSYMPRLSKIIDGATPLRRLRAAERMGVTSGSHRDLGVVALFGDDIREHTVLTDASIVDVAPTLLYLLGLPIPTDMDGSVLEGAFEEEVRRSRPIIYDRATDGGADRSEEGYSGEDAAAIEERLRSLGYIE
jgi:predicted AlkP superfamily phosphohydrolase/phosphomutase